MCSDARDARVHLYDVIIAYGILILFVAFVSIIIIHITTVITTIYITTLIATIVIIVIIVIFLCTLVGVAEGQEGRVCATVLVVCPPVCVHAFVYIGRMIMIMVTKIQ